MIKEVKGNIFDVAKRGIIIHQVNCQNRIGAGLSKEFITRYPIMKEKYHALCRRTPLYDRLGKFQPVYLGPNLIGINSFSQFYYGNARRTHKVYTHPVHLKANILAAVELAEDKNLPLFIPANIGCGLAGGNWDDIYNFIHKINSSAEITIVEFSK